MNTILSMMFVLFAMMPFAIGEEDVRDARAKKFAESPKIDGMLDDACWKELKPLDKFVLVMYGKGLAIAQTKVYVGHHNSTLYVGVDCLEPHRNQLKKLYAEKKIKPLEESVELFVDSFGNGEVYYQFIVGINGETYDAKKLDGKWSGLWQTKTSLTDTGYSIEIAVPFKTINAKLEPGALWKLNICRTRSCGDEKELSTWSDTQGGFHAPNQFGRLVFEDYARFFSTHIEKHSGQASERLDRLFVDYPISSLPFKPLKKEMQKLILRLKSEVQQGATTEIEAAKLFKKHKETRHNLESMIARVQLEIIKNEFKN